MKPSAYVDSMNSALKKEISLYERKQPGSMKNTSSQWRKAIREVGVDDTKASRAVAIRTIMMLIPKGRENRDTIVNRMSLFLNALSSNDEDDTSKR